MPGAKLGWQIAPWAAGALQMKNRFEELPIGHFARRTGGGVFGDRERLFKLGPDFIGDALIPSR